MWEKERISKKVLKGCPAPGCNKATVKMAYGDLIIHSRTQCNQMKVVCPLGCGSTMKRVTTKTHFASCPKAKLSCVYCKVTLLVKDYSVHECFESLK